MYEQTKINKGDLLAPHGSKGWWSSMGNRVKISENYLKKCAEIESVDSNKSKCLPI